MREETTLLEQSDLGLLHEALAFMARRVFDPGESERVRALLDRFEELILNPAAERSLRLSPPEQEVFARQIESYCRELTARGASREGRVQAERLRRIIGFLAPSAAKRSRPSLLRRLFPFWK